MGNVNAPAEVAVMVAQEVTLEIVSGNLGETLVIERRLVEKEGQEIGVIFMDCNFELFHHFTFFTRP
jgi:ABC-type histidine transport system ATPase subunit